jgi:hypothetical protein
VISTTRKFFPDLTQRRKAAKAQGIQKFIFFAFPAPLRLGVNSFHPQPV